MQMRSAEMNDAEAVTALINIAFRKAEGFLFDRDRIDVDTVRSFLQKGHFVLAHEDSELVGCVYLEPRGERAYLGLLSVDPKRQNAGLGSMLMKAAEEHCTKAGFRFIDLRIVSARQELPRFYHRHGYVESGTEPFVPEVTPKVPCHFVWMSKPLV
jgi:predicted N-acetyltransferase YhbS